MDNVLNEAYLCWEQARKDVDVANAREAETRQALVETFNQLLYRKSLLTVREKQVLRGVQRGLQNKEIAAELSCCERTVKFHLKNVFIKLNVQSRNQLLLQNPDLMVLKQIA